MTSNADKTILVVDDEPDVRSYLQMVLEDGGFKVVTATDGEEALRIARSQPVDFISLDLIMPRKSGHKCLAELKRDPQLSKIPVLIVTAHAKTDMGKRDLEEILSDSVMFGPCTYLEKPINPNSYIRSVQRALGLPVDERVEEKVDLKQELADSMQAASPEALRRALEALQQADKDKKSK